MDKKLTDNEIKKAFEYLVKNANNHIPITGKMLLEDILDVLNRKDAEIERLRDLVIEGGREQDRLIAEIERLKEENETITSNFECQQIVLGDFDEIIKKQAKKLKSAKSEAIKEFAERLCEDRVSNDPVVIAVKAELKEMTGQNDLKE